MTIDGYESMSNNETRYVLSHDVNSGHSVQEWCIIGDDELPLPAVGELCS